MISNDASPLLAYIKAFLRTIVYNAKYQNDGQLYSPSKYSRLQAFHRQTRELPFLERFDASLPLPSLVCIYRLSLTLRGFSKRAYALTTAQ